MFEVKFASLITNCRKKRTLNISNSHSRRLFGVVATVMLTLTAGLVSISQSTPAEAASTALICGGDNTRVCAPITNLKFSDRGSDIPITLAGSNATATISSDAKRLGRIVQNLCRLCRQVRSHSVLRHERHEPIGSGRRGWCYQRMRPRSSQRQWMLPKARRCRKRKL